MELAGLFDDGVVSDMDKPRERKPIAERFLRWRIVSRIREERMLCDVKEQGDASLFTTLRF